MLEALYNEEVTLRRALTRGVKNQVTYQEVFDEGGGPLRLRCYLERRRSRTYDIDGTEMVKDATMIYRAEEAPDLKPEDLVVTRESTTFRVLSIDTSTQLHCDEVYARATLQLTRQAVPPNEVFNG